MRGGNSTGRSSIRKPSDRRKARANPKGTMPSISDCAAKKGKIPGAREGFRWQRTRRLLGRGERAIGTDGSKRRGIRRFFERAGVSAGLSKRAHFFGCVPNWLLICARNSCDDHVNMPRIAHALDHCAVLRRLMQSRWPRCACTPRATNLLCVAK